MLRLIFGRAGSGKTLHVMNEIRDKALSGETGLVLLVPEQYSHDAERRLCAVVGDSLSLHGEVLSFSRLSSRVFDASGGASDRVLDNGGKILTMYRALTLAAPSLRIYADRERRSDFLRELLSASDEFKSADISASKLAAASFEAEGTLSEKLYDLSIILDTYDSLLEGGVTDPRDRLMRAAAVLARGGEFGFKRIYIDGFTDFTAQEKLIITEFMKLDLDMTVCLTCDGLSGEEDIFSASRRAARLLKSEAEERGIEVSTLSLPDGNTRAPELAFLEKQLFTAANTRYTGECQNVELYAADSRDTECELAASRTLAFLRGGYRLRDIAVVSCDWGNEGVLLENIFTKYGVPVYLNKKTDVLQKPPIALIGSALEIIASGWEYEDVFAYLKTGLTPLSPQDRDELENYVLKWNIRGSMWTREQPWAMSPSGYERSDAEESAKATARIDGLRRAVSEPLIRLKKGLHEAVSARGQARALYAFLEDIDLSGSIAARAELLRESGREQTADEYGQLWDIIVNALEQFDAIMSGEALGYSEFSRLWRLLLSQYELKSIPVALDRAGLGDMLRHRRRDVKCLIVLGAYDGAMPGTAERTGVLSDAERAELKQLGVELPGTSDDDMFRELFDVYSSLTLPSDRLVMSYPAEAASGRASYLFSRASMLLGARVRRVDIGICRRAAPVPCMELAVSGDREAARALSQYPEYAKRLRDVRAAVSAGRGRLSREAARALYGGRIKMSASKVDQYSSCRFAYFLKFGLKAKPRRAAGFDAPVYGSFMHYILENVTREAEATGGFGKTAEQDIRELVKYYVNQYIDNELDGFRDKTSRFKYLFTRLASQAAEIAVEMAAELKSSEFRPLDFELRFSPKGDLSPIELDNGDTSLTLDGVVDRVDGWLHDGKLYLRVIDYKTGRKAFSLSDIWYGMGMQMLIYLFALSASGGERYGGEVVPAGVLYVPAREITLNLPRSTTDEELAKARAKALRRSGLMLDDGDVIDAMGAGEGRAYLPVTFSKDGVPSGDALASAERLGVLSKHIEKTLTDIAGELARGSIDADPYFRSQAESACTYCEYFQACHFSEETGDRRRFLTRMKAAEVWNQLEGEVKNG